MSLQVLENWHLLSYQEARELADWFNANTSKWEWRKFHNNEDLSRIWMDIKFIDEQAAMYFKLRWGGK